MLGVFQQPAKTVEALFLTESKAAGFKGLLVKFGWSTVEFKRIALWSICVHLDSSVAKNRTGVLPAFLLVKPLGNCTIVPRSVSVMAALNHQPSLGWGIARAFPAALVFSLLSARLLAGPTGGAPTLVADYQFQNNLNSSVAGAPALINLGTNTFGPAVVDGISTTVLSFPSNSGVLFPAPGFVPSGTYSAVVLFEFNDTTSYPWQRIMDFQNRTSDDGLYAHSGALNFYDVALGADVLITNYAWVQVALTRDTSGNVSGYVNGIQEFSFPDLGALAVMNSTNPLSFFQDDLVYPNEASAGSVARIRLYDGALSTTNVAALDRLPGEGQGVIQFSPAAYLYSDISGPAPLTVTRSGPNNGPASAEWEITGGTANPGVDYVATNGLVLFAPGQVTQTFYASLLYDGALSQDQTIVFTLTNAAGASLGVTNNAVITLEPSSSGPPSADLEISETSFYSEIRVGDVNTFFIDVYNNGPSDVTGVTVQDNPASGWSLFDAYTNSNVTFNYANNQWTIASLPADTGVYLNVGVVAEAGGILSNAVVVYPPTAVTDPNPANNFAGNEVEVGTSPVADLEVSKSVDNYQPTVGKQVTFTITLENLGPENVTTPVVTTDCLPAGLQYVTDNTQGVTTNGAFVPGTCQWTLTNGLSAFESYTLQITALVTNTGTIENTVTVAVPAGVTDPNLTNNAASATLTAAAASARADLQVRKTASTNFAQLGYPVFYNLFLENFGPGDVTNDIIVTDVPPKGFQYQSSTPDGLAVNGSYNPANGQWVQHGLASNGIVALGIVTTPTNIGVFTNIATVAVPAGVNDPNLANNTASVVVTNYGYRISGYVSDCAPAGGGVAQVTMTLTGATNLTTKTDNTGSYVFNNVPIGSYTLTPTQPGNGFTPANQSFTIGGMLSLTTYLPNFQGTYGLVQGALLNTNGAPVPNFRVYMTSLGLNAFPRVATTDTNGNYIFTNTPPGSYLIAPRADRGYLFNPVFRNVTLTANNCLARADFATTNRLVYLIALEVTQVIQDWSNSVPLIQNKETWVRAHFQLPTNNTGTVDLNGARLFGPGGSVTPLPQSDVMVSWTNGGARAIRESMTNTFNFPLPNNWLSGIANLRFECTNNVTVVPTNVVPANSTVSVTFRPAPALPVRFFPVKWTNAGVAQEVSAANLADMPNRVLSQMPTATVDSRLAPALIVTNTALPPANTLLSKVTALHTADILGGAGGTANQPASNSLYHAVVPGATLVNNGGGVLGIANRPGSNGVSRVPANENFYAPNPLRHTTTHELGHNLGRPHSASSALFGKAGTAPLGACGERGITNVVYPLFQSVPGLFVNRPCLGPMTNGTNALIYGLDTLTLRNNRTINPIVSPFVYFDLMSYCSVTPLNRWMSTFSYTNCLAYLTNRFKAMPGAPAPDADPTEWLLVRGTMDLTAGTAQFDPTVAITTTNVPPPTESGPYTLIVLDGQGNTLNSIPFMPDAADIEDDEDQIGVFLVIVQAEPNFHEFRIVEGANVLADVVAGTGTLSVGSVAVTDTNGAAFAGSGPMNIGWTSTDTDPTAQLTHTIQYSADGGQTWEALAVDWPGQSYPLDSSDLPASTQGMIQVTAGDGVNCSVPAQSSPFTVLPHPPNISLNAPESGDVYVGTATIVLDATVVDPQDGPLTNSAAVQWTSDVSGSLGSGAQVFLETGTLTEGANNITVTATDSAGLTSTVSAQIIVLYDPLPDLNIVSDGGQVFIYWPLTSAVYLLQSTGDLASGTWTEVTNTPTPLDGIETVTLPTTNTNLFFRLRLQ